MIQLLWNGDAWINGKLGLLHDDPKVPLHVEQNDEGELARFMRTSHGGLRIEPDEAGAGIQGLGGDLTPGSLAINSAGGAVTLGTIASKTRVRGELQVDGKLTVAGRDITADGSKLDSPPGCHEQPARRDRGTGWRPGAGWRHPLRRAHGPGRPDGHRYLAPSMAATSPRMAPSWTRTWRPQTTPTASLRPKSAPCPSSGVPSRARSPCRAT